jgi:tetratricopeptide (TPR) repeat protein
MNIITKEEVAPPLAKKEQKPDWPAIVQRVVSQYGQLGQERMDMEQLLYYWLTAPNTDSLARYYVRYFQRALTHSRLNINNVSWAVFEKVSDPAVLQFATAVSRYNVTCLDLTADAYDTYANLLYKTGKKAEALKWEEKAVRESGNRKELAATLGKMQRGEPTWPQP